MVAGDDGWFGGGEVMAIQSRATIKAIILRAHECYYMQYRNVYEYIYTGDLSFYWRKRTI